MLKYCLAGAALLVAHVADAAVITVDGAFTATDWTVYFGTPSDPIDPLFLSYSITFDDTQNYDGVAVAVLSSNIPYEFSFFYGSGSNLFVLATVGSDFQCTHVPGSFCAFVYDFTTGVPGFVEQSPTDGGGWVAGTISNAVVPEPATWAMLIAGFGLVGSALRRRQTARA